jgi:hypothetical protein
MGALLDASEQGREHGQDVADERALGRLRFTGVSRLGVTS